MILSKLTQYYKTVATSTLAILERDRGRQTDRQRQTEQSKCGKETGLQIVFHSVPGTDCITVHAVDLTSKVFIMR